MVFLRTDAEDTSNLPKRDVEVGDKSNLPKRDFEVGTPTWLGIPMKWLSLLLMVAHSIVIISAVRASRKIAVDGKVYLNTTAVFFAEVVKVVLSFLLLWREKGSFLQTCSAVHMQLIMRPQETLKVSVPSLLYTVQTNLLFISLSHINIAVYQVTYQAKTLTTALFSVLILRKQLGPIKWVALVLLTGGVAIIQLPQGANSSTTRVQGNEMLGVAAVLCACMTSGLAGVSIEYLLKQNDISIWMRNLQLAIPGAVLAFICAYVKDGKVIRESGFLQGYSPLVWGIVLLLAAGGMIIASVLKYADNILKCFGNALTVVLCCAVSAGIQKEFVPDGGFGLGTLLVLFSVYLYSIGVPSCSWVKVPKHSAKKTAPMDA